MANQRRSDESSKKNIKTKNGISPRLEFSTKTTFSEISSDNDFLTVPVRAMTRKTSKKSQKQDSTPSQRHLSFAACNQREYLDRDQVQRLRGRSSSQYSPVSARNSRLRSLSPHQSKQSGESRDPRRSYSRPWMADDDSSDTDDLLDNAKVGHHHSLKGYEGSPSPRHSSMDRQRHNGSLLGSPVLWEEVQERVQSLLTSPKAVHRLACGATDSEIDEVLTRRSVVAHSCRSKHQRVL